MSQINSSQDWAMQILLERIRSKVTLETITNMISSSLLSPPHPFSLYWLCSERLVSFCLTCDEGTGHGHRKIGHRQDNCVFLNVTIAHSKALPLVNSSTILMPPAPPCSIPLNKISKRFFKERYRLCSCIRMCTSSSACVWTSLDSDRCFLTHVAFWQGVK